MRTEEFCRTCCGSSSEGADVLKLLLLVGTAALLGGCRFWYKPVPVANAIGEERVLFSGDSVNVHRDGRFEVYAPNPEVVFDGYEQANRAYRAFERHFGVAAPKLAFVLFRDSVVAIDAAALRALRERGFTVISYARPRSVRSRRRYSGIDYGGVTWPIAPTAARALLARFADAQLGGGPRADSVVLDRFPFWYRAAVLHLIGEAGSIEHDIEFLRERRQQWMPLRNLLMMVRASGADSLIDPSRRSESDETTQLLAAQSATFARFLVEREGLAVLGVLGRGFLAGRPFPEMLAAFHNSPRSMDELERRWKVWVDSREN
jgi:hypothetical protein